MPSVRAWRVELYEIADRLEASAAQWALAMVSRDELDATSKVPSCVSGWTRSRSILMARAGSRSRPRPP